MKGDDKGEAVPKSGVPAPPNDNDELSGIHEDPRDMDADVPVPVGVSCVDVVDDESEDGPVLCAVTEWPAAVVPASVFWGSSPKALVTESKDAKGDAGFESGVSDF